MTAERVWHVSYQFDGQRMHAIPVGCMCDIADIVDANGKACPVWYSGKPHYHADGAIHRQPDVVVRKPCDPLFGDSQ